MQLLSLKNINKSFNNKRQHYLVLNNISLDIYNNEIISIIGVSGSGKTTLLNIVADLESIDNGSIDRKKNVHINYVTQQAHFIEELSIIENLIFASLKDKQSQDKILNYCQQFDCLDLINKKPSYLSGGEKQRINIIRALINEPDLIILDEPTASLDYENKFKVMETLISLQKNKNIALLLVTHDQEIIASLPVHSQYVLHKKTLSKIITSRSD